MFLVFAHDRDGPPHFIDRADASFAAGSHGLDPARVQQILPVRRPDGTLATGVDALIALWQVLSSLRGLTQAAASPGLHLLLRGGYRVFAVLRPLFPHRDTPANADSRCGIGSAPKPGT